MTAFADSDLTDDGFLGGGLRILQPRAGYRAATDPVLLAAAVDARPGQRVLELGCGAGVAVLCLGRRVAGLDLSGIEIQPAYAGLARRNAERNGIALRVIEGDIAALPMSVVAETFDHVIANPPYHPPGAGTGAADPGREAAFREATPLSVWIDTGLRRLRPGGWFTLIQETARLPDCLAPLAGRAGSITVLPVAAREGRPAGRFILRARKGGRGAFSLATPRILHPGPRHAADGDAHADWAEDVLRKGAPLTF